MWSDLKIRVPCSLWRFAYRGVSGALSLMSFARINATVSLGGVM